MRVLITGGAGFIGSHLAAALAARGDIVRVLDDLSSGHLKNLAGIDAQVTVGSILDPPLLAEVMAGVEYVLHHAAQPSLAASVSDPQTSFRVNVQGTLNVLEAARAAGVRRVVYAASSSVYGETHLLPTPETAPAQPITPYAAYKYHGEVLCQSWWRTYGLETVCLRYFNVFGERQDPKNPYAAVIPLFVSAFQRGESPTVFGNGHQVRDFVHVANVVAANLAAMQAPRVAGKVYNIGTGVGTSLLDLIQLLNEQFGTTLTPRHEQARPGDARASVADIKRATLDLSYRASVGLREGLRRMGDE
jgi:UDP-glucose 4-epimerase